ARPHTNTRPISASRTTMSLSSEGVLLPGRPSTGRHDIAPFPDWTSQAAKTCLRQPIDEPLAVERFVVRQHGEGQLLLEETAGLVLKPVPRTAVNDRRPAGTGFLVPAEAVDVSLPVIEGPHRAGPRQVAGIDQLALMQILHPSAHV